MTRRRTARAKVLGTLVTLAGRIGDRATDLGTGAKRQELAALTEALAVVKDALAVLDDAHSAGLADALGDVVDVPTDWNDEPDHGEDSEHEHSDPDDVPVAARRIGFILPRS